MWKRKSTSWAEYWIRPDGSILMVDESKGLHHEDLVVEEIVRQMVYQLRRVCPRCPIFRYGEGWTYWRVVLGDDVLPEVYGDDFDWGMLRDDMVKAGRFPSQEEANAAFEALDSDNNAREFAIKWWKWIRVAQNDAEMPDLQASTLRLLGKALTRRRFSEDAKFQVSIFGTQGRHEVTVGSLRKGQLASRNADLEDNEAAKATLRRLDVQNQPKFYGDKLGDSYSRVLWHTLSECQD